MNCLKKFKEGDLKLYSKISLIINCLLLIGNKCQIIIIIIILVNTKYNNIFLINPNIFLYLIFFSLINLIIIIILEYYRMTKILFQEKKQFTIFVSYFIITINIILISFLFPYLFNAINIKSSNKYIFILIIDLLFKLVTWFVNIIIFQSFKYFREVNNLNIIDSKSIGSDSTNDGDENSVSNREINISVVNKYYLQTCLIEKFTKLFIDVYTQTS